uniref:NADH-ubiquinone oxidoreductase chain 6 n=1 Tax=Zancudomyces culisetae TaxID=1213189 RepID=Q3T4B8_ZANCU|nr:NADH dehydrogenase subunit 6 [Zancudomyces culisetae]AAW49496.1 NADH dehydrogenase subunit 6 [Zancudomyces culisetae]
MIITPFINILIFIFGLLIFLFINPIYSVLSLISVFILTGILFIFYGLTFIGLSYFIIYVGAISILFIFAIMMLETDFPSTIKYLDLKKDIPLITGILCILIYYYLDLSYINNNKNIISGINNIYFYSSNIKLIGYCLYTTHCLWLILISFILLLAMIGPIILCLKMNKNY